LWDLPRHMTFAKHDEAGLLHGSVQNDSTGARQATVMQYKRGAGLGKSFLEGLFWPRRSL